MRRRKLLVALAGLAMVGAAGVVVLRPRPGYTTRENYDRIVAGMSAGEVESILGPTGDQRTGPTDHSGPTIQACLGERSRQYAQRYTQDAKHWDGDSGSVFVRIDDDGQILKEFTPCQRRGRGEPDLAPQARMAPLVPWGTRWVGSYLSLLALVAEMGNAG
jgi:hypothetical protein